MARLPAINDRWRHPLANIYGKRHPRRLLHAAAIMNHNACDLGIPRDSVCSETALAHFAFFRLPSRLHATGPNAAALADAIIDGDNCPAAALTGADKALLLKIKREALEKYPPPAALAARPAARK